MNSGVSVPCKHSIVIPAKAGIQGGHVGGVALDPRLRGGDDNWSGRLNMAIDRPHSRGPKPTY